MTTSNQLNFQIPEYDHATTIFVRHVHNGLVAVHPLLGDIQRRATGHSGPIRNVAGSTPVDHDLSAFEHSFTLDADVIRNVDLDTYVGMIYDIAVRLRNDMVVDMFRILGDVTQAVGNVTGAEGKPLSYDLILDSLEKLHMTFDEDGIPTLPTLAGSPEALAKLRDIEPTPEQRMRERDIMARKKAEHDAQKRTRRLSRSRQ